jgi:hypothetical protein
MLTSEQIDRVREEAARDLDRASERALELRAVADDLRARFKRADALAVEAERSARGAAHRLDAIDGALFLLESERDSLPPAGEGA